MAMFQLLMLERVDFMDISASLLIGLGAGIFGGFFGLGGGLIMIPALLFFFGMNQHLAQGTVLATMIPPIGILAAIRYYHAGNVNLKIALFMCIGFVFGGLIGAHGAHLITEPLLKRLFGVMLLAISIKLILVG